MDLIESLDFLRPVESQTILWVPSLGYLCRPYSASSCGDGCHQTGWSFLLKELSDQELGE